MDKLLTVVIPAYNIEKYEEQCLSSFVKPKALPEIEVLVVNDGSSDRTVEIELTNYRYDIRKYFDKKERIEVFLEELWNGGKRDNPEDFRETVYVLSGYTSEHYGQQPRTGGH